MRLSKELTQELDDFFINEYARFKTSLSKVTKDILLKEISHIRREVKKIYKESKFIYKGK